MLHVAILDVLWKGLDPLIGLQVHTADVNKHLMGIEY